MLPVDRLIEADNNFNYINSTVLMIVHQTSKTVPTLTVHFPILEKRNDSLEAIFAATSLYISKSTNLIQYTSWNLV